MLKRAALLATLVFYFLAAQSQVKGGGGMLAGTALDPGKKPLEGATTELILLSDSLQKQTVITDKDGSFSFTSVPYGYYRLRISFTGFQPMTIDSIHFRAERSDFNMNELTLRPKGTESLGEVIVYAEKPLVESKDGNITFNAAESALSAGSTASELLTNVPLVTKDPDGKISVRGKEPKILIDDKPVELNLQQLQDLLESMPGSSIEKIEVMTNPPPQYANEQGGVINIITRKGKVGKSGRIYISGGTRGEAAMSGNYTYRKQNLAVTVNGGVGYNQFNGYGYSHRTNFYTDSSNLFNTRNDNSNEGVRPNFRANVDYDLDKFQSINAVVQLNGAHVNANSLTEYTNISSMGSIYRLSDRSIVSDNHSATGSASFSYLLKTKMPGEQLKLLMTGNLSGSHNDRDFYQQFFFPDHSPNGIDSTQQQLNRNNNDGHTARADYTKPLKNLKTIFTLGSFYTRNNSDVETDARYLRKPDSSYQPLDALSSDLKFHQTIIDFRGSVRQLLGKRFSVTGGIAAEQTQIWFQLFKEKRDARNQYWTWLPFANINKNWSDKVNLTLAWRRSIRRPGIGELNPTVDFSDPYNIRFGNEKLEASTADNFDLVIGRTRPQQFINLGLGYNIVRDIFSRVRTLLTDGRTQVTWQNISGRKEYEISTWGGLTLAKKIRTNLSATYVYSQYSLFDKTYNKYRDGGSFTSNINTTYTPKDTWNFTGSFNFNRFANPQGYARWNWSMNMGVQRKFFARKLTATINLIDIFSQQRTRSFTYGTNFNLESYSGTRTRNVRLSIGYNFVKTPPKKPLPALLRK